MTDDPKEEIKEYITMLNGSGTKWCLFKVVVFRGVPAKIKVGEFDSKIEADKFNEFVEHIWSIR